MKKILLTVFGLLISCVSVNFVAAQASFASNYDASFTVRNVSQNNIDATTRNVKPGDILMYQLQLTGVAPVTNEVVRVRTGSLENIMTLVDSTDGRLEGSYIYFPTVTDPKTRWTRTFAFYMRVEREPVVSAVTMSLGAQNVIINIDGAFPPTTSNPGTPPVAVPKTGASYHNLLLVVMSVIVLLALGRIRRRS